MMMLGRGFFLVFYFLLFLKRKLGVIICYNWIRFRGMGLIRLIVFVVFGVIVIEFGF